MPPASPDRRRGPVAQFHCNLWATLAICLSLLLQQACSQVVGCDVLDCNGGADNDCTLGNTTSSFIGTTSFNSSLSPDNAPLTWTVGASSSNSNSNSSDVTFTKNFYLGYPPSMNLATPAAFAGCALFFEGIARSLPLNGVTEYGTVTCGQTLQDVCVNDLLSQARQQVQALGSKSNADNRSVCTALQTTMEANPPPSCSIATVTWGTIVPKEITGPQSSVEAPVSQTSCHPTSSISSGTTYNIALVETQTVTSEEVSSDIAPFFYSITPVLTVFYEPVVSSSSNSQKAVALPEAHLSCVKVVENSNLAQQVGNGAGTVASPRSMMAMALALSILSLI
ncbi:uncharacterized protein Z519_03978 [Cladophialophora bantiana CBS 173.52]|uniref:Uncharacterized protein n=1 Tax=Cladophialophora bantiana (strain ATCC 10958 / CBS 173.52 / CDC B-1940 / NIH 8579) TaxID=1442370 RepID=A0A0D2IF41_CLAB1|nr:uncharacterized protein Z519_03978 [Cladophialophora bantiana CBS 173.52]KIW95394.1 hypothetical protein Z519_03978 [Cladophialophora bantiana CBS 173.52]